MTLRLVQVGNGDPRTIAFFFLVGPQMDPELRAALGPQVCILADVDAHGTETMGQLLARARILGRFGDVAGYALCGWSMGCQRIRGLLRTGADPVAIAAIDGIHGNLPPAEWQIDTWTQYAKKAERCERLMVATHSLNLYVERLPYGQRFSAVRSMLRAITGFSLTISGDLHSPEKTSSGDLVVYSYTSQDIDKRAHEDQLHTAMPDVLRQHIAPYLASLETPKTWGPAPTAPPVDQRAAFLAAAEADLTAGFTEHGKNAGPEIEALYLKPLGLPPGSSYCAAAVSSWLRRAGVTAIKGTPGARAMMAQFQQAGLWTAKGAGVPQPGDILVWDRSSPAVPWGGHVGVVHTVQAPVVFTIEANADRVVSQTGQIYAVCQVERRLDDPKLYGWGKVVP